MNMFVCKNIVESSNHELDNLRKKQQLERLPQFVKMAENLVNCTQYQNRDLNPCHLPL